MTDKYISKNDILNTLARIDTNAYRLVSNYCQTHKLYDHDEWIEVKYHKITDEERAEEGYPAEWDYYLDCQLPEEDEEVLVSVNGSVYIDTCCYDQDGGWYLDITGDWCDVDAWKPVPKPYDRKIRDVIDTMEFIKTPVSIEEPLQE